MQVFVLVHTHEATLDADFTYSEILGVFEDATVAMGRVPDEGAVWDSPTYAHWCMTAGADVWTIEPYTVE